MVGVDVIRASVLSLVCQLCPKEVCHGVCAQGEDALRNMTFVTEATWPRTATPGAVDIGHFYGHPSPRKVSHR
jgi:hypothetical protein